MSSAKFAVESALVVKGTHEHAFSMTSQPCRAHADLAAGSRQNLAHMSINVDWFLERDVKRFSARVAFGGVAC